MKGYIFTEFLEMVEERYGYILMDKIIIKSNLKSEGIYTSVGTYNQNELFQLMFQLSLEIKEDIKTIMIQTGERIYNTSISSFNKRLLSLEFNFPFLERLENYLTNETRNIFNNQEIYHIKIISSEGLLTTTYKYAEAQAGMLMECIIRGCISASGENVTIETENNIFEDQSSAKITVQAQ